MQHELAKLLGVDAHTDSLDLHNRIRERIMGLKQTPLENYIGSLGADQQPGDADGSDR